MAMMGVVKQIAWVCQLLMEKGLSAGYFPERAKLYHICPKEEGSGAFEESGI